MGIKKRHTRTRTIESAYLNIVFFRFFLETLSELFDRIRQTGIITRGT